MTDKEAMVAEIQHFGEHIQINNSEIIVTDPDTGGQKAMKLERFDLIPPQPLAELAKVYGKGAIKYDDWNWRKGYKWSLSLGAMQRHINAWTRGERFDPETGVHHLASAAWHCFTLMEFQKQGLGTDDRPCVADASPEYLAGIIDGEGCITIVRTGKGSHELRVDVRMTTKEAVKAFKDRYGDLGTYKDAHSYSKLPNRKPVYRWYVAGKDAGDVLSELWPYLRIKSKQAEIALEFQWLINSRNGSKAKLTDLEKAEREELCQKIQELNR